MPIAPSTYRRHRAQQADPTRRSAGAQRDDVLKGEIQRVWDEQEQVYGAEKVWKQLGREQVPAARWCACGALDALIDAKGNVTRSARDLKARVLQEVRAN